MEEELSNVLWKLSSDIINIIKRYEESGKIHRLRKLWVRDKITNFEYKEGNISWQALPEYFEREEWDWKEFQIIEQEVKRLPSFAKAFRMISNIYNVNDAQSEFLLSRFVTTIASKALDKRVEEESKPDFVITFINDLENNPIMWKVSVELEGVWIKEAEVKIRQGLKIRRPQPEDFIRERPLEFALFPHVGPPFFRYPSAIMEVEQRAKSQHDVWNELEKLIICLRMYKLGSVIEGKAIWMPKSILRLGGVTWPGGMPPVIYRYAIATEDTQKIQIFLNKIAPLLPVSGSRIQTTDYISIALQRYNDALFKPDPTERLAYGIMGLEALFLKPLEREELAHKLAQRVAKCLSVLSYQPLEVYGIIRQSYDIRSEFIHGSLVEEDKRRDASRLADKIINYLRLFILIFLELKEKIEKVSFLNTIDNSLLHQNAQVKLESIIKEHCTVAQSVNTDMKD